ncbi:hypothetical protein BSNK01_01960 [Bacillaceae bacterium]
MSKYLILTNKDTFSTETSGPGLKPVESYDFFVFDQRKANYTITEVTEENIKITITDNEVKNAVNRIPLKLFPVFNSIEEAREELQQLVGPQSNETKLVRVS